MAFTSKTVAQATIALLLFFVLPFTIATAQTSLIGTIVDSRTEEPLPGVEVRLLAERTVTDAFGGFELKVVLSAGQSSLLIIAQDGFEAIEQEVIGTGGADINLGTIGLRPAGRIDQSVTDELIPTILFNSEDLDSGGGGVQNISGVLNASRDAFTSAAAFVFGPARFNIRGYDARYTSVLMNGMPIGDMETGRIFWNNWGGLNDVMRLRTNTIGLGASTFAYGGVGGASIFDTRAGSQRKQLRVSYALSNRTYRNRLMVNYNTGSLPSGWAVSLAASRRWADEGFIEGTPYDAWSYFLSVDRKIGRKAVLNLTTFGAPIRRGKISGAVQEIYDLTGNNFYNANWGFQNGKKRNARMQDVHQPVAMLRLDWELSNKLKWMTTIGAKTGRTGNSALDWYDGADPRPQYYRYLPSWFDSEQSGQIAELWRTDPTVSQIDWDRLYLTNANSFAVVENANGITGNTVSGLRSQYIIEDRRTDVTMGSFNTVLEAFLTDRITLQGGLTYSQQKTENFKTVEDLLGGDFYLNVDRFAEFDSSGIFIENNVEIPNQILREGDRWGYDYDYHIQRANAWAQLNVNLPKVDFFVAASGGNSRFWRDGRIANGKFPETSAGESERSNFTEYAFKGGITYKLDGRNYLLLNGAYESRSPFVRDAFRSPRTRNQLVDGLTQEKITSIEGGYLMRSPGLKIRAIGYYTQFDDQIFNRSLFLDNAIRDPDGGIRGGFVNYIMQGINTQHAGVELAVEAKVTPALSASAVAVIGQYIFTNRPGSAIYLDQLDTEIRRSTIYIKDYNVAGTPNEAYTFALNYRSPTNFWFANINFNYFAGTWLDFYPERRTLRAVSNTFPPESIQDVIAPDSQQWNDIIDQERTPDAFTVDLFFGKSWKIDDVFVYLNVGVSNVLDNQDFRTGGYEQFRFDFESKDPNVFPPVYFYSFGRNYFINLAFRL